LRNKIERKICFVKKKKKKKKKAARVWETSIDIHIDGKFVQRVLASPKVIIMPLFVFFFFFFSYKQIFHFTKIDHCGFSLGREPSNLRCVFYLFCHWNHIFSNAELDLHLWNSPPRFPRNTDIANLIAADDVKEKTNWKM
jgi:hypothetical protein